MTTTATSPTKVADVMRPVPVTITPETTWVQLWSMRGDVRTGGIPVAGPQGTLMGVVSEVEPAMARPGLSARDLMEDPVAAVGPDTPLPDAVELLRRAKRLFVVREGKLVGVVAEHDVLGATDGAIRRQIERTVVDMLPDLDARCLRVAVDDGQVMFTGRVPWHRDVAACSRVAAAIPGVTVVVNRLDYVWDDRPHHRWSIHHPGSARTPRA